MFEFEQTSGVVLQEPAAPEPEAAAPGCDGETPEIEPGTQQSEQPPVSENQRWAVARRRAEAEVYDRARREEREKIDQQFASQFAALGVTSVQDYLQQLGQTPPLPAGAEPLAQSMPEVSFAAQGQQLFDDQMQQIKSLDPAVTSLADLAALPEFDRFNQLVLAGQDMVSAYRLAAFDRLAEQRANAARQAVINAVKSKEHMAPSGGGAQPSDGLTDDIIEQFRAFHPGWSRSKIARYHAQFRKG